VVPPRTDWLSILRAVADGDEFAFLRLSRLINCFLSDFGAYDHRGDWDDVIQDVVLRAIQAEAEGRIRSPSAIVAFLRTATRNRLIDHVRKRSRESIVDEPDAIEWSPSAMSPRDGPAASQSFEEIDVWRAVDALPDDQRAAVMSVYAEGRTYEEAALDTGIPLGSLKRYLRLGLQRLVQSLGAGYRVS